VFAGQAVHAALVGPKYPAAHEEAAVAFKHKLAPVVQLEQDPPANQYPAEHPVAYQLVEQVKALDPQGKQNPYDKTNPDLQERATLEADAVKDPAGPY